MDILTDIARHLPQQTQDRLSAMKLTNKTYDQDSATTMIAAFDPELTGTFTSAGLQIEIEYSLDHGISWP